MLTDNVENICNEFDERMSLANSILNGLQEGTFEWKNAFDERCKILDLLDRDVKDFFFQNSRFIDVKNGRRISDMVYFCAVEESGVNDCYFQLYDWFSQYEEMLMKCFKITGRSKHDMCVTKAKIIPQDVLDSFDQRISNGESYDKVTKEFEDFVYYNSRFDALWYGWDLHYAVVDRVYEDVFNIMDRREFCSLYNTYESLVLNALKMAGVLKIRIY
jgi:hypothetical protein